MSRIELNGFPSGIHRTGERADIPWKDGFVHDAIDGIFTRAGNFQQRKSFIDDDDPLPSDVFGLEVIGEEIFVFSSNAAAVSPGNTVIVLIHPDGPAPDLTEIIWSVAFEGKIYVIAKFDDGNTFHYYDATIVPAWTEGIIRGTTDTIIEIGTRVTAQINDDPQYVATFDGATEIEIFRNDGTDFVLIEEKTTVGGTLEQATATVFGDGTEVLATGTIDFPQMEANATIFDCRVASRPIINTPATAPDVTTIASVLAGNINGFNSSPNFTATNPTSTQTKLTAELGSGSAPNDDAILLLTDGVVCTTGLIEITELIGPGSFDSISVVDEETPGGRELLDSAVAWDTDPDTTAIALAASINANADRFYFAVADAKFVFFGSNTVDTNFPNGALTVSTSGQLDFNKTDIVPTIAGMAGGVDGITSPREVTTLTIGGTWLQGDKMGVTLVKDNDVVSFGAAGAPTEIALQMKVIGQKLYGIAENVYYFSGIIDPFAWVAGDTRRGNDFVSGAGFTPINTEDGSAADIVAFGSFLTQVAFLTENEIQIWDIDNNENLNRLRQSIINTGTEFKKGFTPYGDVDGFYLSASGIRSLKGTNSTNTLNVADPGLPIDPLFLSDIADAITAGAEIITIIEPKDNRLFILLGTKAFAFSFFYGSKVSAWSRFTFPRNIINARRFKNTIVVRAVNTIPAEERLAFYGDRDGDVHDSSVEAELQLAVMEGNTASLLKTWTAIDFLTEGTWDVDYSEGITGTPVNPLATVTGATFDDPNINAAGESTHITLNMKSTTPAAVISKILIKYTPDDVEDG